MRESNTMDIKYTHEVLSQKQLHSPVLFRFDRDFYFSSKIEKTMGRGYRI